MSSLYYQDTGKIYLVAGTNARLIGVGYSGHGFGKNNSSLEREVNIGPIPHGRYIIGSPFDSPTHGAYCLRLSPVKAMQTYGRAGFMMHGDSIIHPGQASEGCIVALRAVRELVAKDHDNILTVLPGGNVDEISANINVTSIASASSTEDPHS